MEGSAKSRATLLEAVRRERFPTEDTVRREARRSPSSLTAAPPATADDQDDEVTLARRRQILNDALTPTFVHRGRRAA